MGIEPRERAEVFGVRRGKVLLAKNLEGLPATFGGGVEHGETPLQAAEREFKEEAGYSLENLRQLSIPPVCHRGKGDMMQKTYFFAGDITGPRETPEDPHPMGLGTLKSPRLAAKRLEDSPRPVDQARSEALKLVLQDVRMKKVSSASGWSDGFFEVLYHYLRG